MTTSDAESSQSIELAAEIVAAFVANNSLPIAELPALIQSVHAALERLASGPVNTAPQVEKKEPAVSIRKSITPDFLVCLDDGKKFKSLRRHLANPRHDAGSIPREMGPPIGLSDGRAELRRGAIGNGEAVRAWSDSKECCAGQEGQRRRAEQARTTGKGKQVTVNSISIQKPIQSKESSFGQGKSQQAKNRQAPKRRPFARSRKPSPRRR